MFTTKMTGKENKDTKIKVKDIVSPKTEQETGDEILQWKTLHVRGKERTVQYANIDNITLFRSKTDVCAIRTKLGKSLISAFYNAASKTFDVVKEVTPQINYTSPQNSLLVQIMSERTMSFLKQKQGAEPTHILDYEAVKDAHGDDVAAKVLNKMLMSQEPMKMIIVLGPASVLNEDEQGGFVLQSINEEVSTRGQTTNTVIANVYIREKREMDVLNNILSMF